MDEFIPCIVGAPPPDAATTVACEIVRVIDGDTVVVEVKQRLHVRLLDCWAPETKGEEQALGLASKKHLEATIEQLDKRDGIVSIPWHADQAKSWSLGRVLGRVWINGHDLSEIQTTSGHATTTKPKGEAEPCPEL